jgi:transglutaminase-like putative cysteine protease
MPVLAIRHLTRYRYRRPVAFGEHRMMLRPLEAHDQTVVSFDVRIDPEPTRLRTIHDVFGASVTLARFERRAASLAVESRVVVDQTPDEVASDADDEFPPPGAPFGYDAHDTADLIGATGAAAPEVEGWARRFAPANGRGRVLEALIAMTHAICEGMSYEQRLFDPPRPAAETLAGGAGSCRDFAVLLVDAARALGLGARFVSGYLCDSVGAVGVGHTHAWAQVFLPSCGWVDLDPTNGLVGSRGLVRVAVSPHPRRASPLCGSWFGDPADYLGMDVEVEVRELPPERSAQVAQGFVAAR